MAGAIKSSTASKYGQSVQPARREPSELEKSNSRDEKTILAFASQQNGEDDSKGSPINEGDCPQDSDQIIELLKVENAQLRRRLAALEESLNGAGTKGEDWGEQDREFARIMEEKTDVIRELHVKIQELQAAIPVPEQPPAQTPCDADLFALSDELERERTQLKDDEKTLMQQMRIMEVQMSRERAELARQRSDIERLHLKMQDQLELASRETSLRERLQPLVRQHQQMMRNGSAEPGPRASKDQPPAQAAQIAPNTTSGLFRRLFGAG
jgi:hypothetical protein